MRKVWFVVSLGLFCVYFLTAVLRFWLWLISLFFAFLASLLKVLTVPLSVLAGAKPPGAVAAATPAVSAEGAADADAATERPPASSAVRPVAHPAPVHRFFGPLASAWRSFWHYDIERKVIACVLSLGLVVLPAMYIVPRPHLVQVLDNNALSYSDASVGINPQTGYVVHTQDLKDPSVTREYINEAVWWLGKLNTQGLKAKLRPGRYYRLWVVGLRWWYAPTLYPNIIYATEVDSQGRPVPPSLLGTAPSAR